MAKWRRDPRRVCQGQGVCLHPGADQGYLCRKLDLGNTGEKTDLTSTAILWYIIVAMEAGLFFMPKFRAPGPRPPGQHVNIKKMKRGGSCAYKNYIRVYRMQAS